MQYRILSGLDEKANYKTFVARIETADSQEKLKRLEISLDRLYNAGIFSVTEFARLDIKIFEKLAAY